VGAVKDGGEFTFITFNLLALVVAVEVTLLTIIGFTMGVVVHRPTNRSPLIADRLALKTSSFTSAPSPGLSVTLI